MLPAKIEARQRQLEQAGIVQLTKSLNSQDLAKHKAMVGFELEVVSQKLDRFGWDRMEENLRKRLRLDWMNVLADYALDEIQSATSFILGTKNPKAATNEHAVKARIHEQRRAVIAALPKAPPPEKASEPRATPEQKRDILKEVGFAPKRFGGAE